MDRLLVVLDDDERVAEVAELHEGLDEPPVVALVQPDRGLVEHVQHAGEPGAALRREADALPLPPGQAPGGPPAAHGVPPALAEKVHPAPDPPPHPPRRSL